MRKLLSVVAAASMLALSGCGASEDQSAGNASPLESITVEPNSDELEPPAVSFDTPLETSESGARIVVEGDGEAVTENQNVNVSLAAFDTETGEIIGDTFDQDPRPLPTTPELKETLPVVYEILVGAKVGSYIAVAQEPAAQPPAEGSSSAPAAPENATEILVLKITGVEDIPQKLSDDEVAQLEEDGALPSAEFDEAGKPAITIPEGQEPPQGVAVQVLEEGDGAEVTSESTVTVKYSGVRWDDGEVFDSSYDRGETFDADLAGGVIQGWTMGLAGEKVGSKVLVTIPGELAYGTTEEEAQGRPAGTLVFVVEIVEAK
ncbi:FKBP-type peptidyl-prolyl cis-trans isomerase [Zhihengliuella sp.]|uniref:FKBP-type peptidyl-prolyl cis-trans isomerase n=1 Tax=Zhihengliuella sp. TaxID=1954483 RepID=UPI00281174D0|nr:FKBP-type peptidyl-prolyl cis-trans isomerase [Zhihengliuella sp.]